MIIKSLMDQHSTIDQKEFITKTIILKIKFANGELITRSKTFTIPTDDKQILYESIENLFENININSPIKLLGVSFGNLTKKSIRQLSFF